MSQLEIIKFNLERINDVSKDQDLLTALAEIKNLHRFKEQEVTDLENYRVASHTLAALDIYASEYKNLNAASEWLNQKTNLHSVSDWLYLNSLVLGKKQTCIRLESLDQSYPFPDPKFIESGLVLIEEYLQKDFTNSFFQKVAIAQALLSLHPFSDGNHRTTRLLLEHWLAEMNLPKLFIKRSHDLLMANPCHTLVFSLEHAITQCLFAMENYIQEGRKCR